MGKILTGAGDEYFLGKPRAPFLKGGIVPKTYNNLWDKVIDIENIYLAYRSARKGKRYRREGLEFWRNLDENLITLHNELVWDMYVPQEYRQFLVYEPKERLISAPGFRDRVIHHALFQIIEPIFDVRLVNETYACRKGRGTHAAVKHVERDSRRAIHRWGSYYVLKCDVSHFFPSIDHDVLMDIIKRKISDKKVLNLIGIIIRSYESAEQDGKGLPIGALTSQLFANIYLSSL